MNTNTTYPRIPANFRVNKLNYKMPALIAGVCALSMIAAGCSTSSKAERQSRESHNRDLKPSGEEQKIDEQKVKEFARRGYDSGIEYAIVTNRQLLTIDNVSNQIGIVQPKRKGKYPLVIYLPGLGESDDAGKNMRNALATSGYVVISFQTLKDDETIMSTPAAKDGDFAYIRHDRYSNGVISNRFKVLTKLLEYINQNVASGDANFINIDIDKVAIAGFDIGATSAMIVAGEETPNISNIGFPVKVSGIIALSPYADFSGTAFEFRYRNINVPVLSVTGDADDDTHGIVPIALHQAPFQYMPSGDKYLLLLTGASHAVIGNGVESNDFSSLKENGYSEKKIAEESSSKGTGRGRGSRNGKKSTANDTETAAAAFKRSQASPTRRAIMEVSIEQISAAFLNAHIKNDALAMEWLKKDAPLWLNNVGQLKVK